VNNFSAKSWRQVTFQWDDDACFALDQQHAELYTRIPRFGNMNFEHLKNKGNACTLNIEFGPVWKHFLCRNIEC
jgi:hypothetical protein